MKLAADPQFRDERKRFALRLHCEDCALFDDARSACAHGFPTHEHRRPVSDADAQEQVVFCKDFELT